MKMGKTPGIDNITADEILAANKAGVSIYFKLFEEFEEIWFQEQVPENWRRAVIVQFFKKTKNMTEYETIDGSDLLCHSKKILASVLQHGIKVRKEEILSENQAGFPGGRRTIDLLYKLRSIADKYLARETDLCACNIDFSKASDSVWREGF